MLQIFVKYIYLIIVFVMATIFLQCENVINPCPPETTLSPITEKMLEIAECGNKYNLLEVLRFFQDNPTAIVNDLEDTEIKEILPVALHEAITLGDEASAQALLGRGVDINTPNEIGFTPLHRVVFSKNVGFFKFLLAQQDTDISCRDNDGNMPLHLAALGDCFDMLEAILARGGCINAQNNAGSSVLHLAVRRNDVELVGRLLADPNTNLDLQDEDGYTPLHSYFIVNWSDLRTLDLLLGRKDIKLDSMDKNGDTPLHLAVLIGNVNAVEKLLQAGALVNIQNKAGDTPLQLAANRGHYKIISQLKAKGANLTIESAVSKILIPKGYRMKEKLGGSRLLADSVKQKTKSKPLGLITAQTAEEIIKLRASYCPKPAPKSKLGRIPMEKPSPDILPIKANRVKRGKKANPPGLSIKVKGSATLTTKSSKSKVKSVKLRSENHSSNLPMQLGVQPDFKPGRLGIRYAQRRPKTSLDTTLIEVGSHLASTSQPRVRYARRRSKNSSGGSVVKVAVQSTSQSEVRYAGLEDEDNSANASRQVTDQSDPKSSTIERRYAKRRTKNGPRKTVIIITAGRSSEPEVKRMRLTESEGEVDNEKSTQMPSQDDSERASFDLIN